MNDATTAVELHHFGQATDPTPSQIRAECLRIQRGWSASERRRRAGESPDIAISTLIPVVRLSVPDRRIA